MVSPSEPFEVSAPGRQDRRPASPPMPNLFVIGAMKCGTTSLHRYLSDHPDVFMSADKEPGYFVRELNWARGEAWYLGLFAQSNRAAIVGESSTHYTKLPTYQGVVERIAEFSRDPRFIYVMRDPVERCVSHYWHQVRSKSRRGGERRDMLTAFRDDKQYLAYSNYAMQLLPYLERFGRERVRILTLEELAADPASVVSRIYAWLGVDPHFLPESVGLELHKTPGTITRPVRWLARFRRTAFWEALRSAVPPTIRRLGATLSEGRPVNRDSAEVKRAIEYIRPICREYVDALTGLIERRFPNWTTTCNR